VKINYVIDEKCEILKVCDSANVHDKEQHMQRLELLSSQKRLHADLSYENITGAELGFEVLRAAKTLKLSIDHDRQPCA